MILGARTTSINKTWLYHQANNTLAEGDRHIKPVNARWYPSCLGVEFVGIAVGMQRLEGTRLPGLEWEVAERVS